MTKLLNFILSVSVLSGFVLSIVAQKADIEYRSYLAHIAAAANALRLDDTFEAKRWLAGAPSKYRGWEWNYLNAEANQFDASLAIHEQSVTSIAISPNGR